MISVGERGRIHTRTLLSLQRENVSNYPALRGTQDDILSGSSEPTLAIGVKMNRVDGGVIIVP